ncbi:MAG: hypothetical protein ABIL18_02575 [candidate division WOR-3 bacterium]
MSNKRVRWLKKAQEVRNGINGKKAKMAITNTCMKEFGQWFRNAIGFSYWT